MKILLETKLKSKVLQNAAKIKSLKLKCLNIF